MRHGSLFSGIGGFDLAAQWMGWENVFHCEIDPFCQRVLKANFSTSNAHGSITELDGRQYAGRIDVLSGGFPCQDISSSGAGIGISGSRSGLWGEMFRIAQQTKPRFVVIENSPNLLKKGFEKILYPLSEEGYNVEWQCLYASDLGKPHGRERVFIVAYSNKVRPLEAGFFKEINRNKHIKRASITANGIVDFNGCSYPKIPEDILLDDGLPVAMDFVGAFGNAIVPQVAYEIFKAIEKTSNTHERIQ